MLLDPVHRLVGGLNQLLGRGSDIRERIARHKFLAGEGRNVRLTASVGAATLPDVAGSADGLVQQADAAMYQVKARGKNGVQVAVGSTK